MTDRVEQETSPSAALDRAWETEAPGRAAGNGAEPQPQTASRRSAMEDIDREVARLKLASLGGGLEQLTEEQVAYLGGWREGT